VLDTCLLYCVTGFLICLLQESGKRFVSIQLHSVVSVFLYTCLELKYIKGEEILLQAL
jgi:hypothetical protein